MYQSNRYIADPWNGKFDMRTLRFFLLLPVLVVAGCVDPSLEFSSEPTTLSYTEPTASGLRAVRPYPNPDDVCQVIREDVAIREPVDNGTFLIACPKHERGAIRDRLNEGAEILGHARHWTILTVAIVL